MTRIFECDWCEQQFHDKNAVHPVEITYGANMINAHVCDTCFQQWDFDYPPLEQE